MSDATQTDLGSVVSLWRYPVKSMMGEELNHTAVTERGLFGDRAYALVDSSDGKVATAKNPRKWPHFFDFSATFIERADAAKMPSVRIALPDGTTVTSDQRDLNQILSKALNREVTLGAASAGRSMPRSTGRTWRALTTGIRSPISLYPRGRSSTVPWSIY
jgi:uncharacterized protein YcbX